MLGLLLSPVAERNTRRFWELAGKLATFSVVSITNVDTKTSEVDVAEAPD
jgi:hypothetical protein